MYKKWRVQPEIVTALSFDPGNVSPATCTDAPVFSRSSLIFEPPFPIREPHWVAGTHSLNVMRPVYPNCESW